MVYDYDGNMVQKNVGGQVTRYVYAGGPAPVAEINVTANTEKDFIQANGRTWGVMEATSNTYFHHDAIGSVVALSNDSGQVTDTYEYEPFGKVLNHQGASTNDYQFVGGYGVRKLNDTLDTMGVRQYSEKVGRFTTRDPLGFEAGDKNFYRYVSNRPEVLVDARGLFATCIYNITEQKLTCVGFSGVFRAGSYSGSGTCSGDATQIDYPNNGPIYPGNYSIGPLGHTSTGVEGFPLVGDSDTIKDYTDHGRSGGFFIHKSSNNYGGTGSTGCVTLPSVPWADYKKFMNIEGGGELHVVTN
jgi:RHS repeat-associated protein